MTLKDIATRVAALDTLKKRVADELDAARGQLRDALVQANEESGTQQISFGLDGTDIGKASLVAPADAAVVTDQEALLAWVRTVAPSEVKTRMVTEIRPAWLAMLLKEATTAGAPVWADPETGEVHDIPGIQLQPKATYAKLTVPAAGRVALAEAWRSRAVWRLALPELTTGEE
jgi:hypothetical protein